MNNIQAYKRCSVAGEGRIITEKGDIRLKIMNISAAGALVSVPKSLELNKRYRFQLMFNVHILQLQFQTDAEIVKLEENDDKRYVYDIRFVNLKDDVRIEIDEAINSGFGMEDESRLIS